MPSRLIAPAPASNQGHIPIPPKVPGHITVTIESSTTTPSIPVATISGQQVSVLSGGCLSVLLSLSGCSLTTWASPCVAGSLWHASPGAGEHPHHQDAGGAAADLHLSSPQRFVCSSRACCGSSASISSRAALHPSVVSCRSCCCRRHVQRQERPETRLRSQRRPRPAHRAAHHPPDHSGASGVLSPHSCWLFILERF